MLLEHFDLKNIKMFSCTQTCTESEKNTIPSDIETNYEKFQELVSNQLIQLVGIGVLLKHETTKQLIIN